MITVAIALVITSFFIGYSASLRNQINSLQQQNNQLVEQNNQLVEQVENLQRQVNETVPVTLSIQKKNPIKSYLLQKLLEMYICQILLTGTQQVLGKYIVL